MATQWQIKLRTTIRILVRPELLPVKICPTEKNEPEKIKNRTDWSG